MPKQFEIVREGQGSEYELHSGSRSMCAPREPLMQSELKARLRGDVISDHPASATPRVFNPLLNCWVEPAPAAEPVTVKFSSHGARRLPVSVGDKSGVFWWVGDKRTGHNVLRIERWCWEEARAEADRLFPDDLTWVRRER